MGNSLFWLLLVWKMFFSCLKVLFKFSGLQISFQKISIFTSSCFFIRKSWRRNCLRKHIQVLNCFQRWRRHCRRCRRWHRRRCHRRRCRRCYRRHFLPKMLCFVPQKNTFFCFPRSSVEQCQFLLQVSLRVFDAKLTSPSSVHDILVGQLTNRVYVALL